MLEPLPMRCVNCGTMLEPPALSGAADVICPVCNYHMASDAQSAAAHALTAAELETQLGALVVEARESGVPSEEIVRVLRDELEFAAELAHAGRRLTVQIIDLGPQEGQGLARPVRDRSSVLRGRVTES